jgi:hypothetical protein
MSKVLAYLLGLSFSLTAAAAAPGPPIRLTGRILPPVPADLRIELAPLVSSYAEALRQLAGETVPPIAATQPRPDGTFELRAPEGGLYRVRARAAGRVPVEILLIPVIEDREIPPVALLPAAPVEITVLGPDGLPARGQRLRALATEAFQAGQRPVWRPSQSDGITDPDGRVTVPQGGELSLVALAPGVPDRFIQTVSGPRHTLRLTRREPQVLEVRGKDGKPRAGVLVRWGFMPYAVTGADGRLPLPASANGANGATLRLEDADGPAAEVAVPALKIQLPVGRTVFGQVLDAASRAPLAGAVLWSDWHHLERTDAQGRFRIRVFGDNGEGEASIAVVAADHIGATIEASLPGEDRPVMVALPPAAALDGIVVDGAGQAVSETEIQARANLQEPQGVSARSAVDGRFRLSSLALGKTYEITARKTGFAPYSTSWDAEPGKIAPLRIVLRKGATAAGRVVDAEGQPIAGAELSLQPSSESQRGWLANRSREGGGATSGADGRFRFSDLGAGVFVLSAARSGFAAQAVQGIEIPAEPRTVDLGEVTLERATVLEGRVTDRRGAAVAGAEVDFFCMDLFWAQVGLKRRPSIATDAEGRFRIEDVPRGARCDLNVHKAGFAPLRLPQVEAPTREPLRIELAPAGTLSGRVVGPQGEPVPEVQISQTESREIWDGDRSLPIPTSSRSVGQTDRDGRFRLTELDTAADTPIDLQFSKPGYKGRLLRGVEVPKDGGTPLEVALEKGETLEGRILSSREEPVAGVEVAVSRPGPSMLGPGYLETVTDGDGVYRLEGLDIGPYDITAESPDQDTVSASLEVRPGVNRLDLTFPGGVAVDGLVVDPAGAPVPGATVSLQAMPEGRIFNTQARANGSFRLRAVADGDYRLAGQADGFAVTARQDAVIHVAGQAVHGLELRLERGTVLTGRLLGFTPEELRLMRIQAFRQSAPAGLEDRALGDHFRSSAVVQGGSYRISSLSPGTWQVMAMTGDRFAQGTVTIDPGMEQAALDLEAPAGFTLTGRVLLDGAPFPGAMVVLADGGQGTTAWDGGFKVSGLKAGHYRLVVAAGGGGTVDHREVDISGDQALAIEISTGKVSGQVLSAAGEPIGDALVLLSGEASPQSFPFQGPTARSSEQGTFELPRIAAGSYRITVRKEGLAPAESSVTVTPGGTVQTVVVLKEPPGS